MKGKIKGCYNPSVSCCSKGASIYDVHSGWGGGGSLKSRRKEQNPLICDSDKEGEGVKKSESFEDAIYSARR